MIGDGPYLWATLAIGQDGSIRIVSQDARGRSV
jgi:hypothetical protein